MSNQPLGITATELFACNPYRILGVPVDSTADEIAAVYKKLLAMSETKEIESYKTVFDFPSLPPFKRDEQTIRTAYVKLASNGYRCFAYSDGVFSTALNVDDVALNLKDITCYDCFLRCYMWLVTNDRKFEEPELWVPLCKYIDKMISSSPEEWNKYFDHRFPAEMNDANLSSLRSFYNTFCDIILLPIKEMVRGSMKCKTAIDILKVANVDVTENFPEIDIPQANKSQNGQPAPKLKIAVKDGEEYYDVKAGKMVNFEAENDAAIENNSFNVASTSISAESIIENESPDTATPTNNPAPPTSAAFVKPKDVPKEEKAVEDSGIDGDDIFMPKRRNKVIIPGRNGVPTEPAAPKITPTYFDTDSSEDNDEQTISNESIVAPAESVIKFSTKSSSASSGNGSGRKKGRSGLSSILESVDKADELSSSAEAVDMAEESEAEGDNIYADALIKMLRSNRSGAIMKSVDTKRIYDNGDRKKENEEKKEEEKVGMDPINMKRYDKSLLNSNFEAMQDEDPKKAREAKYRDISVTEMLNPTLGKGTKVGGEIQLDPIEEFKIGKKKQKQFRIKMWKALGFVTLVALILLFLFFLDII